MTQRVPYGALPCPPGARRDTRVIVNPRPTPNLVAGGAKGGLTAPPPARRPSPARRALTSADIRLVRWSPARMRARLGEVIAAYKAAFLDVHEADPVRAAHDRMTHARRHTER